MADQVFKVVNKFPPDGMVHVEGCRYSSNAMPPYTLIYREGETTKPVLGYIFAHDDYWDAVRFLRRQRLEKAEIWLADAVVVNPNPRQMACSQVDIRAFWASNPVFVDEPPRGTVWCKELTLTKMVAYSIEKGYCLDVVSTRLGALI